MTKKSAVIYSLSGEMIKMNIKGILNVVSEKYQGYLKSSVPCCMAQMGAKRVVSSIETKWNPLLQRPPHAPQSRA
ncbi:MAG: hypothetical protein U9O96_02070 [Candidatus Thermoplasmatota archaeon]|nr:hypothetical protein [Candidatus Thermoplasmatota archaeon]